MNLGTVKWAQCD